MKRIPSSPVRGNFDNHYLQRQAAFVNKLARFLNRLLGMFGLRLLRTRFYMSKALDFEPVFSRLKARQIPLSTVLDIGASDGRWSQKLKAFFPELRYHLIEANPAHEKGLKQYLETYPHDSFILAAVSDRPGEIHFDSRHVFGGTASHQAGENTNRLPCTTVDEEITRHKLDGPFLLKLDTHGFEVPIFEGASAALAETNVIVVEAYNFHLTGQSLTFWELCAYLRDKGFRPADLLEPLHRPGDQLFWQIDIIFLRSDRPEFQDNRYD